MNNDQSNSWQTEEQKAYKWTEGSGVGSTHIAGSVEDAKPTGEVVSKPVISTDPGEGIKVMDADTNNMDANTIVDSYDHTNRSAQFKNPHPTETAPQADNQYML